MARTAGCSDYFCTSKVITWVLCTSKAVKLVSWVPVADFDELEGLDMHNGADSWLKQVRVRAWHHIEKQPAVYTHTHTNLHIYLYIYENIYTHIHIYIHMYLYILTWMVDINNGTDLWSQHVHRVMAQSQLCDTELWPQHVHRVMAQSQLYEIEIWPQHVHRVMAQSQPWHRTMAPACAQSCGTEPALWYRSVAPASPCAYLASHRKQTACIDLCIM